MKTLYDLLGALPDDDADSLRAAFRKAAKANHPDFNPGNEEASERFRRIVRANAILSDGQQRAAYDRLLEVARRQQQSQKPRRSKFSVTFRRLAADALASAVVSVVLIGGYVLYRPFDRPPLASAQVTEAPRHAPAQTALTVKSAELSGAHGQAEQRAEQHDRQELAEANVELDVNPPDVKEPAKSDEAAPAVAVAPPVTVAPAETVATAVTVAPAVTAAPAVTTGLAPASATASPARDFGTNDAKLYRERGIEAYRSGDLHFALINFDLAIYLDPSSSESYINRGIVLHRLGELKRAFNDVAEAKRIDDLNRTNTPSVAAARPALRSKSDH